MKPPSALNGHRAEIRRPRGTRFLNYEGELAVVIGRRMKGVGIDDVLDHVAGYAPANFDREFHGTVTDGDGDQNAASVRSTAPTPPGGWRR